MRKFPDKNLICNGLYQFWQAKAVENIFGRKIPQENEIELLSTNKATLQDESAFIKPPDLRESLREKPHNFLPAKTRMQQSRTSQKATASTGVRSI